MKKLIVLCVVFSLIQTVLFATPKKVEDLTKADAKKMPENRPSVAVVLAGGGAKGFAHLPIMEYIEELDIPIDMIIGTSIGSIVGGFYSAGYTAKDIVNVFADVDWTPIFADAEKNPYESVYGTHGTNENIASLNLGANFNLNLGSGLSNGQNAYELFKSLLLNIPSDVSFDDLHIPFRAVTTDMLTGDALVLDEGDLAEAMRASMSLPAVFEPVNMDGYYFMDGGLRYNLAINVAQKMGYDIIIAIDISQHVRDNPETFSSNPAVAILNTITISQYTTTLQLLEFADLVITPDISNFGTLDFKKSKIIYNEGVKSLDSYKDSFEKIRKQIYPDDYDAEGNRKSETKENNAVNYYKDYPSIVPVRLELEGAYNKDVNYIFNCFKKIQNKPITASSYENFMNDIYLTGNYKSVKSRFVTEDNTSVLRLILQSKNEKEIKVLVGTDFQQIVTTKNAITTDLELDLQFRGYTGVGSMFAIHGTFITDLGGEVYFFQPFNPYVFMDAKVNYFQDNYTEFGDNITYFSDMSSCNTFGTQLDFGIRTLGGNLFTIGGYYKFINNSILTYLYDSRCEYITSQLFTDDYSFKIFRQYFGVNADFDVSLLDSAVFSTKGIAFNSTMKLIAPFENNISNSKPLLFTGKAKGKVSIPFGRNYSFSVNGLYGTEFLNNFTNSDNYPIIAEEGFNTYDRVFFPSVTTKKYFGTNIAAATACLQYKFTDNLTIFGGDAYIRAEGTAGAVNYDWSELNKKSEYDTNLSPIIWSGTLGFGVQVKSKFNILLRLGVCSNYNKEMAPLFCLDMGDFSF